jgi:fibro-slime domain-containing protein
MVRSPLPSPQPGSLATLLVLGIAIALAGCNDKNGDAIGGAGGAGATGATGGASGNGGGATGGAGGNSVHPDANFTFDPPDAGPADDGGGSGGGDANANCGQLMAVIRDFNDTHPDFEKMIADDRGLVKDDLGSDDKPVYAPAGATPTVSGAASFDQWYRDVSGVNMRVVITLPLTADGAGNFVYSNNAFFPIDGKAFDNQGRNHNYHFTTEIHATFTYKGGEKFRFTGDDDVFIFINKKLALDLGGVHKAQDAMIDFDAQAAKLGITKGNTYAFDAFHAERHTVDSNFRMETSIACLESGPIK